jgi:hypothetical protein
MQTPRPDLAPRTGSTAERAAGVLRRAAALARIAVRGVGFLAVVSASAVALACVTWIVRRPPIDANDWAARAAVLAIALVPSGVLAVFLAGLRRLAELPRRARELPPDLRTRVADVRGTADEPRGRVGTAGAVVRLGRLLFDTREILTPYAVVTAALRPALLLGALLAAFVAVVEIPVALIVALALAVS